jgi:hypothetical protein
VRANTLPGLDQRERGSTEAKQREKMHFVAALVGKYRNLWRTSPISTLHLSMYHCSKANENVSADGAKTIMR